MPRLTPKSRSGVDDIVDDCRERDQWNGRARARAALGGTLDGGLALPTEEGHGRHGCHGSDGQIADGPSSHISRGEGEQVQQVVGLIIRRVELLRWCR